MDQYSEMVVDWLNGVRNLDGIKTVVDSGNSAPLLNAIRQKAEDTKSMDDLEMLMSFFSSVLETTAVKCRNPLMAGDLYQVAAKNRQRMHEESGDALDSIARAASRSLDPIAAEYMLKLGFDELPDDVRTGVIKYVVQAHPDPKIRKKYMEILKKFEEKEVHIQARQEAIDFLKSAEFASPEAEEAADKLIADMPLTAPVGKYNELAMLVANAGFLQKALDFLEAKLGHEELADEDKSMLFQGMGDASLNQEPSVAAAYYQRAMDLDQKNISALVGLAKVHKAEERWDDALAILRKGIALTAGKPQEPVVLMGLADVLQGLAQWDQAEKYVRRVRALNPRNKQAIIFYEDYYTYKEDWQRMYSTLQFHLSIEKDPAEKVRITRRLSSMAMDKMDNKDKAVDVLKRLVLMDPSDEDSREKLIQVYEEAGKWRALVELYNDIVRKLPSSEKDKKVELLKRVVAIYQDRDRLNNKDLVLTTYGRIAQLVPEDVEVLRQLAEGYETRGNWSELLMVLKQEVDIVKDPEEQLEICRKIVDIGLGKLSNERVALPYLEKIRDLDPHDVNVLTKLVSAYEHKREYEKLLDVLRLLIPIAEPEEREKLLYKAAVTAKERLGKNDEALDYYEELYGINNALREAREVLHQLYTRLGEWERYAVFLGEEVNRPMPERRRVELLGKLGEIKMDRLDDTEGARQLFEKAISIQPHDVLSQRRLEEIYIAQGDFDALKGVLSQRGQLRGYVNMLSEREMREEDPERKVNLALEMARTCENELKDMERAVRYYDRAYTLNPMLTEVGQKLVDYYAGRGYTEREIETLSRMAGNVDDIAEERSVRERLFSLWRMEGKADLAFDEGKKAIELAVSMGDFPKLINNFTEIAKSVDKWDEYAELLIGVAAVSTADKKVDLLLEVAEIYRDRLDNLDGAISTLMGVLDVEPRHPEALSILEEIAFQKEDFKSLEGIYRRQIEVEDSVSRQIELYLKLGGLYEDFLMDDEAAVDTYTWAQGQEPGNRFALAGLHRCYERMELYPELAAVLRMEADSGQQASQKNLFRLELARVLAEKLNEVDDAVAVAEQALTEEPGNQEVLQFLMDVHTNPDTRMVLAETLPALLDKLELWAPLENVLLEQVDDSSSARERSILFEKVARLRHDKLGNTDSALDILLLSVSAFPNIQSVDLLVELGSLTDRDVEVAQTLESWVKTGDNRQKSDIVLERPVEQNIFMRIASIYDDRLEDIPAAIRTYEGIAALDGDSVEVLQKLAGLYRKQGDNSSLLATLTRLLDLVPLKKSEDIIAEAVELAVARGDYDAAIPMLNDYVHAVAGKTKLADKLEEIYTQKDDKDALYDYLVWLDDKLLDGHKRADNLYKLAGLRLDHLGDYDSVIPTIRQVLVIEPLREDVLGLCERIAFGDNEDWLISMGSEALNVLVEAFRKANSLKDESRQGERRQGDRRQTDRREDLAHALLKSAELEDNLERRLGFLTEAADLLNQLDQKEQAFYTYRTVFEADPALSEIRNSLVALGNELGKADELVDAMRTAADSAKPELRIDLLLNAAGLLWRSLGRVDEAGEFLEQLYAEFPSNPELLQLYTDFIKAEKESGFRIDFLNQVITKLDNGEIKRSMQMELAGALEESGNITETINTYVSLIQARPDPDVMDDLTLSALNAAISVTEEAADTAKLFEFNFLAGKLHTDKDEKIRHFYAATQAGIKDDSLKDRTVEAYRELLALLPDSTEIGVEARKAMVAAGKADEAIQMLVETLALAPADNADETRDMKNELARLYIDEAGRPEEALGILNDVLSASDDDVAVELLTKIAIVDSIRVNALLTLLRVYESRQDWSMLTANSMSLIELLGQDPQIKTRLMDIVETLRVSDRLDEATELLVGCLRQKYDDPVLTVLGDVLADAGRPGDLSSLVAGIVDAVGDTDYGVALRTSGAAYLVAKGETESARDLYRLQVEENPDDRESVQQLKDLYQKLDDADGLVFVIGLLADIEEDDAVRKGLLIEGGEIARDKLNDLDLAENYFMRVFGIDPNSWEAFSALEILYRSKNDSDALYGLHLREFESLGGMDTNGTWRDSGLVLISEALDRSDIKTASLTAVTLMDSGETGAECIAAAKSVLFNQEEDPSLFSLLEQVMQDAGDDKGLLDLYRNAVARGLKWPPREDLLRKAIEIENRLGNKDLMWEDMLALTGETPGDLGLWTSLRQLGQGLNRADGMAAALKPVIEEHKDMDTWVQLTLLLEDVLEKDLKDAETAEYYLRILLQEHPSAEEAFSRLETLLLESERFVELGLSYEASADSILDPEQRHEKYMEAARLFKETDDAEHALELLDKCIMVGWKDIEAADFMLDIARESNSVKYLIRALLVKFEQAGESEQRIDLGLQISGLYLTIKDTDSAVEILMQLLNETGYANAEVVHSLEKVYIDSNRIEELAALYVSTASAAAESEDRLEYIKKAAQLYELKLNRLDDAINLLRQVLDEVPDDQYAYSRLIEILSDEDRPDDIEALYRIRLGLNIPKAERIEILTAFAKSMSRQERWDEALDRADQGLRVNRKNSELIALVEDIAKKNDTDLRLRAYSILEDTYRHNKSPEDLVRALEGRSELADDVDTRRAILLELAGLESSKMKRPEKALKFVAEALQLRVDENALELLDAVGSADSVKKQYYDTIQEVIENTDDLDLAIKLHKKSAELALESLSDPSAAADHYIACMNNDKLDKKGMEDLEKILGALNRHQEQVTVLKELVRSKDEKNYLVYILKLGDIYLEKLQDTEGAFEEYSLAIRSMGRIETIEDRLISLIHDPVVGVRVIELLKPLVEEDLDFDRMIELIMAQIEETTDEDVQSDLFYELAETYDRMGDRSSELRALGEALVRKPGSDSIARDIVTLAEVTQNIETAVDYLERAVEKAEWTDVKKDLYLKISGLSVRDPALASHSEKALNSVLQLDPNNWDAIQKLEALYQRDERVNEYVKLLEIKVASDSFFEDRDRDLKKLADLYLNMQRLDDAAVALRKALEIHPMDVDGLSRLMDIEETTENKEGGVQVVNQVMSLPVDCDGCAALLRRAAEFILFKVGDKALARNVYEKLWRHNPEDQAVKNQLVSLLKELEDWNTLFSIYDMVSDRGKGEEAVASAMAGAELAERWMHNPAQTIRMYMRALEHDPNNTDAMDELIRLYYDAGYWSELISIFRRKAKITPVNAERTGILLRAIDLAKEKVDDDGLVTEILNELLEYDPTNISAMLLLSKQLYVSRDLEGAEAIYKRILDIGPPEEDMRSALIGLAKIYSDMKVDSGKIRRMAQQVLQINPYDEEAVKLLKESYLASGDNQQLISLLEGYYGHLSEVKERSMTALEIAKAYLNGIKDENGFLGWVRAAYDAMPNNPEVVKTLVDYYKSKGELSKARSYLEWLVKYLDKTRDREGLVRYSKDMGMLLESEGEDENALKFYVQAFRMAGDDIELRLRLGVLQGKLEQRKEAIKTLQPLLLKLSSLSAESKRRVLLTLAEAHRGLGERHKMRQYVLRLLADNPNDEEAENFLTR